MLLDVLNASLNEKQTKEEQVEEQVVGNDVGGVEYRQDHDRAFSQYDAAFQERVFHVLVHDREWAQEISEVMSPNMFDEEHLRFLSNVLWQFFRRYKAFPSVGIFVSNIKDVLEDMEPTLRSRVVAFLPKIAPTPIPTDASYIKDKVEGFCRRQNFRDALMRSVDLMKDEKYDSVFTIMKNAVSASTPGSKGHDFHMEREARWEGIERDPIQTGLAPLDKVIGGGLSNGELGVVVAATGCHAAGTPILMFDGTIKNVEDVRVGDQLMGPDSQPRNVLQLARGRERMVRIIPTKGESFVVNESHILSLIERPEKPINDFGEMPKFVKATFTVKEWLSMNADQKTRWVGWRLPFVFNESADPIFASWATNKIQDNREWATFDFVCEPLEEDDFYGFSLDGDHLYLMGDHTVTHNTGKSHWLVNVGAQAVYDGKNVVHYTFELSEHATGRRYDSWFTNIDSNEILTRKDDLMLAYARLENERNLGQLYIKEYPTGTASVVTLKGHLERLRMTGFVPDLIIVDYADIMKAASGTEGERFKQKAVYEELRALSKEMKLPIWTASQSNREGAGSEIITSEQMGESYGKAQVADLVVSLSRKPLEKANGTARMFVAKNRMGSDGFVFGINIDTARSQFEENEELMDLVDAQRQDAQTRKRFTDDILRETNNKWNKVSGVLDRINNGE